MSKIIWGYRPGETREARLGWCRDGWGGKGWGLEKWSGGGGGEGGKDKMFLVARPDAKDKNKLAPGEMGGKAG